MYGSRLTRDFGDSVPDPWKSAIKSLTDSQIQKGLRRLTAAGSASTPTLPGFVKACKTVGDDEGEGRQAASYLPPPSFDDFHCFGQRALFAFVRKAGYVSEETLQALVTEKNRLVNDFRAMNAEEEVTAAQMREALMKAFERIAA
jgi:hypothetical protein